MDVAKAEAWLTTEGATQVAHEVPNAAAEGEAAADGEAPAPRPAVAESVDPIGSALA